VQTLSFSFSYSYFTSLSFSMDPEFVFCWVFPLNQINQSFFRHTSFLHFLQIFHSFICCI
jgi:hypothetical protein